MSSASLKLYGLCHFTSANVLTDFDKHNLYIFSLALGPRCLWWTVLTASLICSVCVWNVRV